MFDVARDNSNMAQKYGEKLKKPFAAFFYFCKLTSISSTKEQQRCFFAVVVGFIRRFICAAELHNIKYIENKSASVQD